MPVVGMGTWRSFDVPPASARDRAPVLYEAISAGVQLVDTSPMYGWAEQVLARLLGSCRPSVVLTTKVWTPGRPHPVRARLDSLLARLVPERRRRHFATRGRVQIERALALFGGYVDLYLIHNAIAWDSHLPVLEALRAAGLTRAIGVSHYDPDDPELHCVLETGRVDVVQVPLNPLRRQAEEKVLPLAAEAGLGVILNEPFNGGELLKRPPSARELAWAEAFGVRTWPQVLLKWALSDPRVHAVIPATKMPGRMAENAAAGEPPWFGSDERERVVELAVRACEREADAPSTACAPLG